MLLLLLLLLLLPSSFIFMGDVHDVSSFCTWRRRRSSRCAILYQPAANIMTRNWWLIIHRRTTTVRPSVIEACRRGESPLRIKQHKIVQSFPSLTAGHWQARRKEGRKKDEILKIDYLRRRRHRRHRRQPIDNHHYNTSIARHLLLSSINKTNKKESPAAVPLCCASASWFVVAHYVAKIKEKRNKKYPSLISRRSQRLSSSPPK